MDSALTKMLEGVLGTLDHHGDFDVEIHTDSEGQTLNYSMMNHPIVSAHYAGKVITDVNPGSQTCQEIEDSLPACTDWAKQVVPGLKDKPSNLEEFVDSSPVCAGYLGQALKEKTFGYQKWTVMKTINFCEAGVHRAPRIAMHFDNSA